MAAQQRTSGSSRSPLARLTLPALSAALLFGACKIEPKTPVLHYELNDLTTAIDEETGESVVPVDVQEQIYGALGMLFGTPSAPGYMLTKEWFDDGWNPNYPQYPEGDDGSGEISDDEFEAIYADNERVFAEQLAFIDAGDYASVRMPLSAPRLAQDWQDYVLAEMELEDFEMTEDFQADARAMFSDWYPSWQDSAEMYRVQCLHCHGTSGGGNGPTSEYLNPRPRDYRQGQFKFSSVKDKGRPTRDDLFRIIEQGATGTSMPSFRRFSRAQIWGMVDYVRLLSIRGDTELYMTTLAEEDDWILDTEKVLESYVDRWDQWRKGDELVVNFEGEIPEATPEMIERGRQLYNDATTGNCYSCHGENGRGLGSSAVVIDEETGELVRDPVSNNPASAYLDDWGDPILPRNLVYGVFRGGKRPIDIYRRIYSGINGGPMPGIGSVTEDENPAITKNDIWAMVHYVRSLSEVQHHAPGHDAGDHNADDHNAGEGH